MKTKKKTSLPNIARLRVDDEEFDAVPLEDGTFQVAEVVLSHLCTHGDVVRADGQGRVVAVVRNRYETKVSFCESKAEAERLTKRYASELVPHRMEMGDVVLAALPIDFDHYCDYIHPIHEKEEYDYAWGCIEAEFGDFDCEHGGEVWQHMDSLGGEHCFRHRNLPGSSGYTHRSYPFTKGWKARRPVPRARLLRAEYGIYEDGVFGYSSLSEDGVGKEFLGLDDHDSLRVRRHVVSTLGPGALKDKDVLRFGRWAKGAILDMLAATLTNDSVIEVEYLDR